MTGAGKEKLYGIKHARMERQYFISIWGFSFCTDSIYFYSRACTSSRVAKRFLFPSYERVDFK